MPSSAQEGKQWSYDRIKEKPHNTILDIGPGIGTYGINLRTSDNKVDAVEIFEPYVDKYDLRNIYDDIFIGNFLDFPEPEEKYDWIILGDVLEHFNDEDAKIAYAKAKRLAHYILLSCPDGPYPQGELEGNVHETHLSEYTYDQVSAWPGVEQMWKGQIVLVAVIKS